MGRYGTRFLKSCRVLSAYLIKATLVNFWRIKTTFVGDSHKEADVWENLKNVNNSDLFSSTEKKIFHRKQDQQKLGTCPEGMNKFYVELVVAVTQFS